LGILSGCSSQSGQSLAQQACTHVHRSVQDFVLSTKTGTPAATVAQLQQSAARELREALPLAAAANSADGSWNSLMTTISEGSTVDESHLVPALRAQCTLANSNVNVNPQNGNPRNGNPQNGNTQNINPQSPAG
jgi:hypothetical protein